LIVDLRFVVCLFSLVATVYVVSPVRRQTDSRYTVLLSEVLLDHGVLYFDPVLREPLDIERHPRHPEADLPASLRRADGLLYYFFPPGTSILSAPLVAVARGLSRSTLDEEGRFDKSQDRRLGRIIACFVTTLFILCVYWAARTHLDRRASFCVALGFALATPAWSTASRELWSHDWALVLMGLSGALMLRAETTQARTPAGALLGTLLAWAIIVRPTAALPAFLMGLWLLWRHPAAGMRYLAAGAGWVAAFVVWSKIGMGSWIPPYFDAGSRLASLPSLEALAGNLVSPSRGFFVYVPVALAVAWLVATRWSDLRSKWIALFAAVAILLHWWIISSFPHWWGGHSYGPRLMTDTLPWWAILTILGLDAARRDSGNARFGGLSRSEVVLTATALALSVGMNAAGAISKQSAYWNAIPVGVESQPERLWDWRDPAFLRWLPGRPE